MKDSDDSPPSCLSSLTCHSLWNLLTVHAVGPPVVPPIGPHLPGHTAGRRTEDGLGGGGGHMAMTSELSCLFSFIPATED